MKSVLLVLSLVFAAVSASAGGGPPPPPAVFVPPSSNDGPALFLGLTWSFGNGQSSEGSAGVSLKVLSSTEDDEAVAAAGLTYNFDGSIGCDLGVGYNLDDVTGTVGYDFCRRAIQLGLGARVLD